MATGNVVSATLDDSCEELRQEIRRLKQQHTPLPGNFCQDQSCNGAVVKKVVGLFRGKFEYSLPACRECGRPYFYAQDVRAVGEQEFWDCINKPFTV